jgi:hypothetical protein
MQYERSFMALYGRNLAIGHVINVRISRWGDEKWDKQVRMFKDFPPGLLADLLQSEFPITKILGWAVIRPYVWFKVIRYTFKGILTHLAILKRRGRSLSDYNIM